MKHVRTLVALPAVAVGIVLAGATQASARPVDPDWGNHESVVVVHEPGPTVQVHDTANEARQAGAAAIGGAAVALAAVWIHRRRHPAEAY
jgi:hypothetical protein